MMANVEVDISYKRQFVLAAMPRWFNPQINYNNFRNHQLKRINESNIEYYSELCSNKFSEYELIRDKPFIGSIINLINSYMLQFDINQRRMMSLRDYKDFVKFTRSYRSVLRQPISTVTIALMELYNEVFEFFYDNCDKNVRTEFDSNANDDDANECKINNIINPTESVPYYIDLDKDGNYTLYRL